MTLITPKQLKGIVPGVKRAKTITDAINEICPKYDIDTSERVAMFIAQCAHESSSFNVFEENLNYSRSALLKVFGSRHFTPEQADQYARKPEMIANRVYRDRMDNGPESSGDGWRFRGAGAIQLTGKYNHSSFAKYVGMRLNESVEYVKRLPGAIEAACWFWKENGLNKFSDRKDVRGATKRINGGYNGLDDRVSYYRKAESILLDEQPAVAGQVPKYKLLTAGSRGTLVKAVQNCLGLAADGQYGPNTKRAVKKWQHSVGLTPDGVFGKNSYSKMFH